LGWFRKVIDYVLGYEVEEIIMKDGNEISNKKEIGKIKKEELHKKQDTMTQHPLVKQPKKEKGEVQTRVAYQYPQGKFRFPLIPDEEVIQKPRPRRKEMESAEDMIPRRQPYRDALGHEEKTVDYQLQKVERTEKEEQSRTRSFRPTDVPSPIYGFKQRPTSRSGEQIDKAIEIELPSSSSRLHSSNISYKTLSAEQEMTAYKEVADRYDKLISPLRPESQKRAARRDHEDHRRPVGAVSESVRNKEIQLSARADERQQAEYGSLYKQVFRFKQISEENFSQNALATGEEQGSSHRPVTMYSLQVDQTQNQMHSGGSSFIKRDELPEQRVEAKQAIQWTPCAEAERVMEPVQSAMNSDLFGEAEQAVQAEQPVETRQIVQPAPYGEAERAVEPAQPTEEQSMTNRTSYRGSEQAVQTEQQVETRQVVQPTPYGEEERMMEPVTQRTEAGQSVRPQPSVEVEPAIAGEGQVGEIEARIEGTQPAERVEKRNQPLGTDSSADSKQPAQRQDRPRRPFVPFNVMMLKKDRQQLEKRELARKSQQSSQTVPMNGKTTEYGKDEEEQKESNTIPFSNMEHVDQRPLAKDESPLQKEPLSSPLLSGHREGAYEFPSMSLLNVPKHEHEDDHQWLEEQRQLLDMTLKNFNVRAKVVNVTQGPTVTRFEVQPEPGVKVNKITNLTDDIKLSLAARDIRIEAPIPGKNTIGIEVPNRQSKAVLIQEILSTPAFQEHSSPLAVALGLDISGMPIVTDLKKMPHGLIAGATGSGKSVCINTIIVSLLYKASPHQVKLMLIDPKMVELAPYNGIPHLVSPVITDAKAATAALKWAVEEMERRYELFAHTGVRDITKYNEKVKRHNEKSGELPYLVIIIDELADLMMVSPGEVEEAICRIAQKARACGIHLLLATQRPSVDVITGLIKANVPTRVAFSVSSQVDSRTIIDTAGAEKLLGRGDMLLLENGSSKTVRVQGNFVSDEEIDAVVDHVKKQMKPNYLFEQKDLIQKQQNFSSEEDELFYEACEFVLNQGGASTSSLQRHFRIGYNRAARLIDMMEEQGIISEAKGSKPRDVLITEDELTELQNVTSSF
jgi:DNA segregation ATPase FtsK/SpoIIIE, S-DNA-T family